MFEQLFLNNGLQRVLGTTTLRKFIPGYKLSVLDIFSFHLSDSYS